MNPQEQHEYDVAVQNGHQHFYDHIPVRYGQVLDLFNAIKKKKPELIVVGGVDQVQVYIADNRVTMYRGLQIAYADTPNEFVGYISFDRDTYSVNSRLIENARYSSWNSRDYHAKKSIHMNNVVKEAIRYLLPTQMQEVVLASAGTIQNYTYEIRERARRAMNEKLRPLENIMRDEIFNMIANGYTPKNEELVKAMEYVKATEGEYDALRNYEPERAFVWIKPNEVIYRIDKEDVVVRSTDELPEDIRGKLFVLMVGDAGKVIEEIGLKVKDNQFWVFV
jgi:hypothetical protein